MHTKCKVCWGVKARRSTATIDLVFPRIRFLAKPCNEILPPRRSAHKTAPRSEKTSSTENTCRKTSMSLVLLVEIRNANADGLLDDHDLTRAEHRSADVNVDILSGRPHHLDDAALVQRENLAH